MFRTYFDVSSLYTYVCNQYMLQLWVTYLWLWGFSQVQERLQESEEREGLLGKRLTAALKQERELKFALETARQQRLGASFHFPFPSGIPAGMRAFQRTLQRLSERELSKSGARGAARLGDQVEATSAGFDRTGAAAEECGRGATQGFGGADRLRLQ